MPLGAAVASGRGVLDRIANPPVVNPLAIAQGAAQAASTVYDLRQKQGQQAWGQALLDNTDKETGVVNYQGAAAQVARQGGDAAAYGAAAGLGSVNQLGEGQFKLSAAQQAHVNAAIAPILSLPDNMMHDALLEQINRQVKAGVITQDFANRALLNLSSDPKILRTQLETIRIGTQPTAEAQESIYGKPVTLQLGDRVVTGNMDVRAGNISSGSLQQMGIDPNKWVDVLNWKDKNGNDVSGTRANYMLQDAAGNVQPGSVHVTLNPAATKGGPNDQGAPSTTNKPTLAPKGGATPPPPAATTTAPPPATTSTPPPAPASTPPAAAAPSTAPPAAAPAVPPGSPAAALSIPPRVQVASLDTSFAPATGPAQPSSPAVTGDVAAMLQGVSNAQGNPLNAPPSVQVAGGAGPFQPPFTPQIGSTGPLGIPGGYNVGTSTPPGIADARKAEMTASADAFNVARQRASTFASELFPLTEARDLIRSGTTTGKGAEMFQGAVNFVESLTGRIAGINWADQSAANLEKIHKYLQMGINSMPLAAQSDSRLASAIAGSPGTHLTSLTNEQVLDAMVALRRMEHAAYLEFSDKGLPNYQWSNFMANWGATHDPRVFATDSISDDAFKKMWGRMTPSDKQSYMDTLAIAQAHPELMSTKVMP